MSVSILLYLHDELFICYCSGFFLLSTNGNKKMFYLEQSLKFHRVSIHYVKHMSLCKDRQSIKLTEGLLRST